MTVHWRLEEDNDRAITNVDASMPEVEEFVCDVLPAIRQRRTRKQEVHAHEIPFNQRSGHHLYKPKPS